MNLSVQKPSFLTFLSQQGFSRQNNKDLNSKTQQIYQAIIDNQIHFYTKNGPPCDRSTYDTNNCDIHLGALSECPCPTLSRTKFPKIREQYENYVAHAIIGLLPRSTHQSFHLKIACFCSGRLLGEQVLFTKLIDSLQKRQGTLDIFLIDRIYDQAIQRSSKNSSDLPNYIQQFKQYITDILPQKIQVNMHFFASSQQYDAIAKEKPQFKHHILIGADIEKAKVDMANTYNNSSLPNAPYPIALLKIKDLSELTQGKPQLCRINPKGEREKCFDPRTSHISPPKKQDKVLKTILFAAGVSVCIVVAGYFIHQHLKKNNRPD